MNIDNYYKEIENELKNNILAFWNKTVDEENGGFLGKASHNCWKLAKKRMVNRENEECLFSANRKGGPYLSEGNKVCSRKAPYHKTRGCLEIMKRLKKPSNLSYNF